MQTRWRSRHAIEYPGRGACEAVMRMGTKPYRLNTDAARDNGCLRSSVYTEKKETTVSLLDCGIPI